MRLALVHELELKYVAIWTGFVVLLLSLLSVCSSFTLHCYLSSNFFNATQKSTTKEKDQIPTCAGDLRACGFKVIGLVGVNSIPGTRSNMRSYGNKRNERTNFKPEK